MPFRTAPAAGASYGPRRDWTMRKHHPGCGLKAAKRSPGSGFAPLATEGTPGQDGGVEIVG